MNLRKSATVALVALVGLGAPMFQSLAVAQPTASAAAGGKTTGSLSAVEKANLIAKLKAAKQKKRDARKTLAEGSPAQVTSDKKLYEINVLITKIGNDEDVPLSDVDRALDLPGSAP